MLKNCTPPNTLLDPSLFIFLMTSHLQESKLKKYKFTETKNEQNILQKIKDEKTNLQRLKLEK